MYLPSADNCNNARIRAHTRVYARGVSAALGMQCILLVLLLVCEIK